MKALLEQLRERAEALDPRIYAEYNRGWLDALDAAEEALREGLDAAVVKDQG